MFKRIFLFMLVNLLTIVTISLVLNILGVRPYMNAHGIDYQMLAEFCAVWGMGGAFISLLLSKFMAKMLMGVQVIDPKTQDSELRELLDQVAQLARASNLPMPEVGIYDSPIPNAFATGPSKSSALVAVSTGLLQRMNSDELEGVLGHELTHISNGDMVTMTLIQGVINAFVMFFARIAAFAVSQALRGNDRDDRAPNYFLNTLFVFIFEILFSVFGMMVVAWFSRAREFRADAGGARLAGRDRMIGALRALQRMQTDDPGVPQAMKSLQISGGKSWMSFLATHPPLEVRIAALEKA